MLFVNCKVKLYRINGKMTEKLYYKDPDTTEFIAKILDVEETKEGWKVLLDKTFFFPESGGQPADRGWINDVPVIDVKEKGGDVFHFLSKRTGIGPARGKIDRDFRTDYMQQHTGQHIISAAFWETGKFKTVSVHMGENHTTIEIETPDIKVEEVLEVENLANLWINRNLPIEIVITDSEDLSQYPLRKSVSVKGEVRLVHIKGVDYVGCSGLHLKSTGEVGLVKFTGIEKIRGNTRISWKIGRRAYKDYGIKTEILAQLRTILETHEGAFVDKLQNLKNDFEELNKKCNVTENQLVERIEADLIEKHSVAYDNGITVLADILKDQAHQLIKKMAKRLIARENIVFCLINREGKKLSWSIGCSEKIDLPFKRIHDEFMGMIEGKGGGRHPLWQGVGLKPAGTDQFLANFKRLASEIVL